MSKRNFSIFGFVALMVLLAVILTAATPVPVTTFTLVDGLPATMNVGETHTVVVQVNSDQPFLLAQALPDLQYPGKGVVTVQGGDTAGRGTSATLTVTFEAKGATAKMPNGVAPVSVVVGVRYAGGYVVVQPYDFLVQVP